MNFKRLFYGSKDVFGLDVGSSYVKAVQLRQDEQGYSVVAGGWTRIAQEGADKRTKINNVVNAIRTCIKSAQIKTKYAVCGISGPNVALRRFKFPEVGTEEIERAHWVSQGHLDALAREQGGEAVDYLDKDGKVTDVEADMVKVKVHYSKLNLFSDEKGIIRVISL